MCGSTRKFSIRLHTKGPVFATSRGVHAFSRWIIGLFASPAGVVVLAALDSTVFFTLPLGIDAAEIFHDIVGVLTIVAVVACAVSVVKLLHHASTTRRGAA